MTRFFPLNFLFSNSFPLSIPNSFPNYPSLFSSASTKTSATTTNTASAILYCYYYFHHCQYDCLLLLVLRHCYRPVTLRYLLTTAAHSKILNFLLRQRGAWKGELLEGGLRSSLPGRGEGKKVEGFKGGFRRGLQKRALRET